MEIEEQTSHTAADVIFRRLFSIPIEHEITSATFTELMTCQRSQPILNLAAFLPLPRWIPRFHRAATKRSAKVIRGLITKLIETRATEIVLGTAPNDLATKNMTTPDPLTGQRFQILEMVDQVAIFLLAGHETSASALAWTLYLLATHPEAQARVTANAATLPAQPDFAALSRLKFTRDVFRKTLRLYPAVSMMVRENTQTEDLRGRNVKPGAQIVLSPWHLHRHDRFWPNPNTFDPDRWTRNEHRASARDAYMPFSTGPPFLPRRRFCHDRRPFAVGIADG